DFTSNRHKPAHDPVRLEWIGRIPASMLPPDPSGTGSSELSRPRTWVDSPAVLGRLALPPPELHGPMTIRAAILACFALAACATTYVVPSSGMPSSPGTVTIADPGGTPRTARDFRRVAARIEPQGERFCTEESPGAPRGYCDY